MPRIACVLLTVCAFTVTAHADLGPWLNFEDALSKSPGGDDSPVTNQYALSHGVTFSVLTGATAETAQPGLPTYEKWGVGPGDPHSGFLYGGAYGGPEVNDVEAPQAAGQLGDWFLKSANSVLNTGYVKLIIDYAAPVDEAQGEIWDIDGDPLLPEGTEAWEVTAYDRDGHLLTTLLSPDSANLEPAAYDGLPWQWHLVAPGMQRIEIEFTGTKTNYVGLAFDNFRSGLVPEPASGLLLLAGGLILRRRR